MSPLGSAGCFVLLRRTEWDGTITPYAASGAESRDFKRERCAAQSLEPGFRGMTPTTFPGIRDRAEFDSEPAYFSAILTRVSQSARRPQPARRVHRTISSRTVLYRTPSDGIDPLAE